MKFTTLAEELKSNLFDISQQIFVKGEEYTQPHSKERTMLETKDASHRTEFFEQLHHEFLYLKGYGTYAYITAHAVDQLYESYLVHQKTLVPSISRQLSQTDFIRTFIKSL